jgi:hypothetical protein
MMTNAYYTGLYSYYYSKYKSLSYNTIITSATSSTQYGMYLYYYNTFDDGIIGNRIRLQTTSSVMVSIHIIPTEVQLTVPKGTQ